MANITTTPLDQGADTDIESTETRRVLQHHFEAAAKFDLDETMLDYAKDAILIGADKVYVGRDAVRGFYTATYAMLSGASVTFELTRLVIVKDIAFIVWKEKTPAFEIPFGTDTFIIKNGKIIRQTGFA